MLQMIGVIYIFVTPSGYESEADSLIYIAAFMFVLMSK
jgi:hypothetical protein